MIKHPFHLKFAIISGRGVEVRVSDRITRVAYSRLELAGMENRMEMPGSWQFKLERNNSNL